MKCPGYCCSYPVIQLTRRDLARLAAHFGITPAEAQRKFTRTAHDHDRVMRRKADEHFGRICHFFDTKARRCTVYASRPDICRTYPGGKRCGYYDFLMSERRRQDNPEYVAITDSSAWE
jgi:hypothetical protein